jgi:phosphatidylglycerol:prolipoprotein diacylglycerol transferase
MSSEATEAFSSIGVHPCFLYESLWCILGFVLLHIFSRRFRRYDGQVFLLYIVWYGIGRFFIEGLRTDSLLTPYIPLRISQLVAAASVLAGVVLLIVFRKRTVLTGCGSKKIMELNSIIDVVPEKKEEKEEEVPLDDGTSTIFESAADAKTVLAGGSIRDDVTKPAVSADDDAEESESTDEANQKEPQQETDDSADSESTEE